MSDLAEKVWITRTGTGAAQSAKDIAAAGYSPLIAPLLKLSAVSTPDACPADDNAIAFTSPNGVRAFTALTDRRNWPVFAVGVATGDMARAAGFEDVQDAGGDVQSLTDLIIKAAPQSVTHLSGVHVAGDLAGSLTTAGIFCERTIIYGTQAVKTLPGTVVDYIKSGAPLAVLLYSPKGAHIFAALLPPGAAPNLHCISISANVDATLDGAGALFASRQIAKTPDAAGMTALLETVARKA